MTPQEEYHHKYFSLPGGPLPEMKGDGALVSTVDMTQQEYHNKFFTLPTKGVTLDRADLACVLGIIAVVIAVL